MTRPEYQGEPQYQTGQPPETYPPTYQQSYIPNQPYVQGAPQYQGPPKKKFPTWAKVLIVLGTLTLLACGGLFVACGAAVNEVSNQQSAKAGHVKVTACNVQRADAGILPNVKVDLTVTNSSKNQNTYFIDVFVLNSANERVGNSTKIVSNVRPGSTAKETEMVLLTKAVTGKITCSVDKVS